MLVSTRWRLSNGAENQWVNPANGVNYQVTVQTPQALIHSVETMQRTPVNTSGNAQNTQLLSNLTSVSRAVSPALVSHYNSQPVYDIFCDADQRDLGGTAADIQKILDDETKSGHLPPGRPSSCAAQVKTMHDSFLRLGIGVVLAVIFVYFLLMAVNFQSWLDPFIILMAIPGVFAGIVWMSIHHPDHR